MLAAAGTLTLVLIASAILFVALLVYTDAPEPGWTHATMTIVLLALAACPFDIGALVCR